MRSIAYDKISQQLSAILVQEKKLINHIDLWNNQLTNIGAEKPFKMPAVFLEFLQLDWRQLPDGLQQASMDVNIHILTGTLARSYDGSGNQTEALQALQVCDLIHLHMHRLNSDFISRPVRIRSTTDHDHDQLQHFIETYRMTVTDTSAMPGYAEALVENLVIWKGEPEPAPEPEPEPEP